jgi:hypothetical protein
MVFLNTNGLMITGNTITTPMGSAIFLGGGNNNVSITCNTITGSPSNGISVSNPFGIGQVLESVSVLVLELVLELESAPALESESVLVLVPVLVSESALVLAQRFVLC